MYLPVVTKVVLLSLELRPATLRLTENFKSKHRRPFWHFLTQPRSWASAAQQRHLAGVGGGGGGGGVIGWSRGPASARSSRTRPRLWSGAPLPEVSEPWRLVVSLTLWSEAAALIMETGASREPETAEVLPQHKFDCRSLEAYLHQHLPGFGVEPEAKLTVAQYRYRRQPSPPAKTDLCLVFFFLWPWVGSQFPPSCLFFRNEALCRRELPSPVPCITF